jgi:hypothetical protein
MNRSGDEVSMADVYAADSASRGSDHKDNSCTYIFSVEADAEPDVFGRVANLFCISNVAPRKAQFLAREDGCLDIHVELCGITGATADAIRRKLTQLTAVLTVQMQEILHVVQN